MSWPKMPCLQAALHGKLGKTLSKLESPRGKDFLWRFCCSEKADVQRPQVTWTPKIGVPEIASGLFRVCRV